LRASPGPIWLVAGAKQHFASGRPFSGMSKDDWKFRVQRKFTL
jgi:hypothetical protein